MNVVNLLNGQRTDALDGRTTRLHCDSLWLTPYDWDDQALDDNGDPVWLDDEDTQPETIANVYPEQRASAGLLPFYSTVDHAYFFLHSDIIPEVADPCSGNTFGFVDHPVEMPVSIIVLCPESFTLQNHEPNLQPFSNDNAPAKCTPVSTFLPLAATFYHELYHFQGFAGDTPDFTCKQDRHIIPRRWLFGLWLTSAYRLSRQGVK
jgi:hypothetical protein